MNLQYITCSDPREFNDASDIINLMHISPRAEVAVQAHPSKMSPGMDRRIWFEALIEKLIASKDTNANLAVHINREYVDDFCNGKIAVDIKLLFDKTHFDGTPVIKRWQVNINGRDATMHPHLMAQILRTYPNREFIFQYDASQHKRFEKLYDSYERFSVLYDESGGNGIAMRSAQPPLFHGAPQGYSGGISPENVANVLDMIYPVALTHNTIWIDAEGKLKNQDKRFDIKRARNYINTAEQWLRAKSR